MGRLENAEQVLGTGQFNIMMGNAALRAGRLHEQDDEMREFKVKCRKSREYGGVCAIERHTHLSL
jgi:hypothetical protein